MTAQKCPTCGAMPGFKCLPLRGEGGRIAPHAARMATEHGDWLREIRPALPRQDSQVSVQAVCRMTARQIAGLMDSREVKRGRLWKAKCPAHNGKGRSLDISDGKQGVLLTCWSHHCTVKEICGALGIKIADLFEGNPTPQVRRKVGLRDRKDALERKLGLVIMLRAIDEERYWTRVEKRIRRELFWVRWELEQDRVEEEILKWHKLRRKQHSAPSSASMGGRCPTATHDASRDSMLTAAM